MANLTKKSLAKLVERTQKNVLGGEGYSLFALSRGIFLPTLRDFGYHIYSRNEHFEKKFDRLLTDGQFAEMGYTDCVGGPVKPLGSCGFSSWENEIENVLRSKEPENLIYYVRERLGKSSSPDSRILISVADFYGGLTEEEAIKKYGKKLYRKMCSEMTGVTVSKDFDGKIRTPFRDLSYAYKRVLGMKTHPEEWD